MNLAIIEANNSYVINADKFKSSKLMMEIKSERLIQRIIRIARINGITKVFYLSNSHEKELKHNLLTNNFGITLKLIEHDTGSSIHSLLELALVLPKESFFLVNTDSVFTESEFSEFVAYSLLQEDADGVLAITKYNNDENSLCVAMNDDDIILKFSDSGIGYSWAAGGIYYLSPGILDETKFALQAGISGLEKFLQLLIGRGYILKGFSFSKIIKVKNLTDFVKAEDFLNENK